ncbi:Glutathione synthetase [invertebrate metagenome]|uniref:Glutathione synthetase n=1 Tax=invertebrate metagenome TaxID=1711999 RepID=A0A484H5M1_9ZZZZ
MSLVVAIQMDPIESIDINTDSTFVLALEAQRRHHALFHYLPQRLSFRHGQVHALACPLVVRREPGNYHTLGEPVDLRLAAVDVILMRQNPLFDMAYITATHFLEHIHPRTLVVNDPVQVRNAPEKLFVTHFPDLIPPTLVTASWQEIHDFRREHVDIIIKPLFSSGGTGVFRITPEDENLNALLEMLTQFNREPIVVQKYLSDVRMGDKRIVLIDGEPGGAVNRVPQAGEARSNLHVGGRAVKTTLSRRDREICETIGPILKARGLVFVGIDVIGPYLTEINVTSPTGLQEINRFDGECLEARIWDAIESRRAALSSPPVTA